MRYDWMCIYSPPGTHCLQPNLLLSGHKRIIPDGKVLGGNLKASPNSIGPPKKNTNLPNPRAIATHTRIEALLLADNLNISFNDAVKHIKGNNHQVQKQDRCSANHKNKRKPPQKIQRSQGSSANENQEIYKEQLEEDSEEVNGEPIKEQEQDQSEEESDYFNIESEDSEDSEDL
ncbi:hypothetical protein M422DRAFT_255053 [Sphaerobolus stellatus SS14]|uniref:Uncharacterized protein n=1 Tax=Sphaerobolus stellatus (strain SS14) TaxID=990650 RepID=A0A0C9VJF3_SPHS4|nr:hypothetical protein M422DRAFT_255053 [Sphaerobolus stellatus SS14]